MYAQLVLRLYARWSPSPSNPYLLSSHRSSRWTRGWRCFLVAVRLRRLSGLRCFNRRLLPSCALAGRYAARLLGLNIRRARVGSHSLPLVLVVDWMRTRCGARIPQSHWQIGRARGNSTADGVTGEYRLILRSAAAKIASNYGFVLVILVWRGYFWDTLVRAGEFRHVRIPAP